MLFVAALNDRARTCIYTYLYVYAHLMYMYMRVHHIVNNIHNSVCFEDYAKSLESDVTRWRHLQVLEALCRFSSVFASFKAASNALSVKCH